jgi:probable phosphoglycerate mutase
MARIGKTKPSMTLVVLVRHGTTGTTGHKLPGRAPGLDLSDDGRQQAKAAAARVAGLRGSDKGDKADKGPVPVLYASPLERAQQTAEPIAAALGCEIHTDEGLVDLDTGEWTGMELKDARKRKEWATIQRHPSEFRFPAGESFLEMQARMVGTVDRLRAEHPGQLIVVVSHADPIRAFVTHAMGAHLDMFQRLMVSPCSVSAIAFTDEGPMVLAVNATDDGRAESPT